MTDRADAKIQSRAPRIAHGWLNTLALSPGRAGIAIAIGAAAGLAALMRAGGSSAWVDAALAIALAWCAMIDIDRYRLPDLLTLPMIAGGLAYGWLTDAPQFPNQVIGAAAGYLSLVAVAEAYRLLRKRDGLGRGDAKLMAVVGAWLGWKALPLVVLGASASALIVVLLIAIRRGNASFTRALPFGPFIAIAFWVLWLARPWPLA